MSANTFGNKDHGGSSSSSSSSSNKRNRDGQQGATVNFTNPPSNRKLSHALSWVLRHSALDIGLTMREDGYVPVQEILDSNHPRLRGATLEQIQEVVATSDKQRYKLDERPMRLYYPIDNNIDSAEGNGNSRGRDECVAHETAGEAKILCIRANQGHSIKTIQPDLLLNKLSPTEVMSFPSIIHGTYSEAWKSIEKEGLSKRSRTHIHFVSGLPDDGKIISGMRRNCSVHIYLDVSKCAAAAADGIIEFYASDNGVILTDGVDNKGILPPEYFSHVTESSTANILLDNRSTNSEDHRKATAIDE